MFALILTLVIPFPRNMETQIAVATTAELVDAIHNGSENQTIQLSPGIYRLAQPLCPKPGMKIIGDSRETTIITHDNSWEASPKSLPDPESRLKGLDRDAYLIDLGDKAADVEIAKLTLRGPQVHGAVFGFRPNNLHLHHLRIENFMWSGIRTLGMSSSRINDCEFIDAGGKWKKGGIVPEERGGICGGAMFLTWVSDTTIAHNRFRRTNTTNARAHFGIKGRQGKRCRIHHNTIEFGFSIEFPFEGDQDMEIDHNILRGAVSIPKYAGGKVPQSGRTFHIHHNYFTTSYDIEFVRNGVEIDHNLFDFDLAKDGGNLISGFGKAAASGPAKFHNNLVNNPGRGVIWINEPYNEFEIRNNHIIARTTETPRGEGLFAFNAKSDFKRLQIKNNLVECQGLSRPLLRKEAMYAAKVHDNRLINVSDSNRFAETPKTMLVGLEEPLRFNSGVHEEMSVNGWNARLTTD